MGTREHAFVVGGGSSRTRAAIALRQKGLRVTVADAAIFRETRLAAKEFFLKDLPRWSG